jgi:predicted phosphodiesterase
MKIFAISDTHGRHEQVVIPEGTDMLIHAGDFSNIKLPAMNHNEVNLFLIWLEKQPVKYKVIIAGNHDTSIEKVLQNMKRKTQKLIKKVQTEQVLVTPNPQTKIKLSDLNKILDEIIDN